MNRCLPLGTRRRFHNSELPLFWPGEGALADQYALLEALVETWSELDSELDSEALLAGLASEASAVVEAKVSQIQRLSAESIQGVQLDEEVSYCEERALPLNYDFDTLTRSFKFD